MNSKKLPSNNYTSYQLRRRDFLAGSLSLLAGSSLLSSCTSLPRSGLAIEPIRPHGPASKYTPTIWATFVRRKEDYGMWWPGAIYDGEAAQRKYTSQLTQTANDLGVRFSLRPQPIYSVEEADAWLAQAKSARPDGLMVVTLDRQQHSWPTAYRAVETKIPTVVFSPIGTAFTENTKPLADKPGCVVYSTDEFSQAAFGMKMLAAAAKINRLKCIMIAGDWTHQEVMPGLGITFQYVPGRVFLDEYYKMQETDEVLAVAQDYWRKARKITGATKQDVINGIKSYFVARRILENEQGDTITMACLATLRDTKVSLPCIAWSRMLDEGIPAACEADQGAVASHTIVQYLFDRPGFQQDPVPDTAHDAIVGAHCTCATRLNGFDQSPEPFELMHHHGNRDATVRTLWRKGQRITSIDVLATQKGQQPEMLISTGTVLSQVSVPPSGGCITSVRVKFDGNQNVLSFPGFHQVFFYGQYKQQLLDFCKLLNLKPKIV